MFRSASTVLAGMCFLMFGLCSAPKTKEVSRQIKIQEEEVKVGFEILKSLGVRNRGAKIVSCPSCARQQFQVIDLVKKLEKSLEDIQKPLTVSIIGCVVNGPGEANMTNIGITGGGNNTHMIYVDGNKDHIVKDKDLAPYLEDIIRKKAENKSIKK